MPVNAESIQHLWEGVPAPGKFMTYSSPWFPLDLKLQLKAGMTQSLQETEQSQWEELWDDAFS